MTVALDNLGNFDAYLQGLMARAHRSHALPILPLVQTMVTALLAYRDPANPPVARTYKGVTANQVWWTSKRSGIMYTIIHRSGDILIRRAGITVVTLDANTPLHTVDQIIGAL